MQMYICEMYIGVNVIVCNKRCSVAPRKTLFNLNKGVPFSCIKRRAELRKLSVSEQTDGRKFCVANRWRSRIVYIQQELAVPTRLTPFIARSLPGCITRWYNFTTSRTLAETSYVSQMRK